MVDYGIGDRLNCVGVIGTVATETASTFLPVREAYYLSSEAARIAWYKDTSKHAPYNGGWWFYGRGFIQTTHDYNYKAVQDRTGLPTLANPDLLLEPLAASHALCIYWQGRNISAICQRRDWAGVRRAVYGGADQAGAARMARIAQVLGV
jgi:predicted chitinase